MFVLYCIIVADVMVMVPYTKEINYAIPVLPSKKRFIFHIEII